MKKDNVDFSLVSEGKWEADGKMKMTVFPPMEGRFVRIEVLGAHGGYVMAEEIEVGAFLAMPKQIMKRK